MREAHVLKLELGIGWDIEGETSSAEWWRRFEELPFPSCRRCASVIIVSFRQESHRQSRGTAAHQGPPPAMALLLYFLRNAEENYLTDIRSLRRTNFKHLTVLNLSSIPIMQKQTGLESLIWDHFMPLFWRSWPLRHTTLIIYRGNLWHGLSLCRPTHCRS